MKEDARGSSVKDREITNEEVTDKVSQGQQQFQFMLETNPQIKSGLSWFEGTIKQWDMASASGVYSRENRLSIKTHGRYKEMLIICTVTGNV